MRLEEKEKEVVTGVGWLMRLLIFRDKRVLRVERMQFFEMWNKGAGGHAMEWYEECALDNVILLLK